MYILVTHQISNPEKFWGEAQKSLPNLPQGIKIHSVLPNETMNYAACLWEANSVDQLRTYLLDKVGDVSENRFDVLNEQNAMGVPGK